jgi:putative ABC transport system permease protein
MRSTGVFQFFLAIRLLWRNWRSGELKILAGALVVAVAVVTAIAVFAERMDRSIQRQSNGYLAADRQISSRFPIPDQMYLAVADLPLETSHITEFASMVYADEDMVLASIKAVADGYPLRGNLEISSVPFGQGDDVRIAEGIPARGNAWVDSRVLPMMGLALGDTIEIGESSFVITQLVMHEPDGQQGFSVTGPRVMINEEDLADTQVVLPGSRIRYRWLFAGADADVEAAEQRLEPLLGDHYRLLTLQSSQRSVGNALDRGKSFLMLAGMIGVMLAGVAIAIASKQFAERQQDAVAVLKSLGATSSQARMLYAWQMLVLGSVASLVGLGAGQVLHLGIAEAIAAVFATELLPPSFAPYVIGLGTGLLCLLCFAVPPIWPLPKLPPIRILRPDVEMNSVAPWQQASWGLAGLIVLMGFYSGNAKLTFTVIAGIAVVLGLAALVAVALLRSSRKLGAKAGSIWRLAIANMQRNTGHSVTQLVVFGTAIMLLLVLFLVRTSLIDQWRLQIPEDAPNNFVLNMAPHEKDVIMAEFEAQNFKLSPQYPMVLGRLTGRNAIDYTEEDRDLSNALQRELNLSWAQDLAADNKLLEGQWWDQWQGEGFGVSVEQETAEELGLSVGDRLQFSLGGLPLEAEIASIRSVDWNSLTPNFYFLFSPGALDGYAPTYMTSIYVPDSDKAFISKLIRRYPTVVIIEVDRIIDRIQSIIDQVGRGVELVLWVVMLGGLMVLVAAVNASMDRRLHETSLLRALGSGRGLIVGSLWIEFSGLGLLAGVMGRM